MNIDVLQLMTGIAQFLLWLSSYWPLSLAETIAIGNTLFICGQLLIKGEFKKLAEVAEKQAMPLFGSMLEDDQRRDRVLTAMYAAAPVWFKKIVTYQQIDTYFDELYAARLKPKAKREGLLDPETPTPGGDDAPLF